MPIFLLIVGGLAVSSMVFNAIAESKKLAAMTEEEREEYKKKQREEWASVGLPNDERADNTAAEIAGFQSLPPDVLSTLGYSTYCPDDGNCFHDD